jgi:CspA family cold shock protein
MPTGTVKWFNVAKGYGFIRPADGTKDVFVHIASLQAAGLDTLSPGQIISYDAVVERGMTTAANLKLA